MFGNKDNRFEVVYNQANFNTNFKIIKDKETGVCYRYAAQGYGGGITPLLDSNGNPKKM